MDDLYNLREWLLSRTDVGNTVLMPLKAGEKQPLHSHKDSPWTSAHADAYMAAHRTYRDWALLVDGICVVDADSRAAVEWLEALGISELRRCPVAITTKGRHYFLRRPSWADDEGFYDGAKQVRDDVDLKTRCRSQNREGLHTRGVIVISPTAGKSWMLDRAPWEEGVEFVDIPRALMVAIAKARPLAAPTGPKVSRMARPTVSSVLSSSVSSVQSSSSSPSTVPTTGSASDAEIRALLEKLSPSRWDDRTKWLHVGTALKNVGCGTDEFFALFDEFSRRSAKFDPKECRKLWDTVGSQNYDRRPLAMGSLVMWAREDSATVLAAPQPTAPKGAPTADEKAPFLEDDDDAEARGDKPVQDNCLSAVLVDGLSEATDIVSSTYEDLRILLRSFPEFEKLDDCSFNATSGMIRFETGSLSGEINKVTKDVYSSAGEYIGNLTPNVALNEPLSGLHSNITPEASFKCDVTSNRETVLSSAEHKIRIGLVRRRCGEYDVAYVNVDALKQVSVTSKQKLATVSKLLANATDRKLKDAIGESCMMMFSMNFINNGPINVYEKTASQGLSDDALITTVMAAHPELHERVCFSPETKTANCGGLFYCDPATNVWQQRHNVVMEEMLVGMFKDLPGLSTYDKRHIESRRGRADMVHMLAAKAVDERFRDRLDANLDLFALSNSCVTTEGLDGRGLGPLGFAQPPKFKDLEPQDYVSITTGWEYSREQAVAARPELEDFLAKVLPIPEERRVVLAYFASLLSGRRVAKKILVMTDRRAGNNGKSSFIALMGSFFGGYTELSRGTKFVCKGSYERDRDSHDAGLEPFRGKRLVVAEELKSNMALDVALLKRVAGGAGVQVGGRVFGSKESFSYDWQAGIVLIFNEGDLPSYDQADLAFRERLLFAPMRSKFVKGPLSPANQDEWTFEADLGMCARFPEWRSALADVLMEHYGVEGGFEQPPQSMMVWRDDVTAEANPVAQWCEDNFEVTGDMGDFVLLGDQDNYTPNFKTLAKAFYAGVAGTMYVNKTMVKIQGVNVSKRYVLKGVSKKVDVDYGTSSPMEELFKSHVENITGLSWNKQRPRWLRNTTGHTMELDMVCQELNIAVEYNGDNTMTIPTISTRPGRPTTRSSATT